LHGNQGHRGTVVAAADVGGDHDDTMPGHQSDSLPYSPTLRLYLKREIPVETIVPKSVLQLAVQEHANVEKHLELLGDTYDLISMVEALYDTLPGYCKLPLDVETNDSGFAAGINANLMLVCRRELTVGVLTLLRGYRVDFLFHMRKAIEFCAFAAKMARHPALSRIWFKAASSDEDWENFRNKFKKLYPPDDVELTQLYQLHDRASEAMHSSPKAVAHFLLSNTRIGEKYRVSLFDIRSDAVFMAYFIMMVHCHLTILAVFHRILKSYTGDTKDWEVRLLDAKIVHTRKHLQWTPLVQTGITKTTGFPVANP